MHIAGNVSSVLSLKQNPGEVYTISPDATVFEAIAKMAEKNVGALVVTDGDKVIGMLSERDYTRKVALKGRVSRETPVRDIISTNVITVSPHHSIEECMRLMTEHRIRHLPVMDGNKLVGIISIGDLVNWIIKAQERVIKQLENYIHGNYIA